MNVLENDIFNNETVEESTDVLKETENEVSVSEPEETVDDISENGASDVDTAAEESESTGSDDEPEESSETVDGEEPTDDEEDERPICPRCEKGRVDEDHDYCKKCEKELAGNRIPLAAWIFGILSLVVSLLAFVVVCLDSAPALQVLEGDMEAKDKNWYNAYTAYSGVDDVVSQVTDILGDNIISRSVMKGCGVKAKEFDSVVHCYSPLDAVSYMSYIFDENDDGYIQHHKDIKKYSELSDRYKNTYSALEDILSQLKDNKDADGNKVISEMEAVRGTENVDDVFLDYFIYNVAGYCGFDDEKILGYIEKIDKTAKSKNEDFSWLYYNVYADTLVKCGREEEALPLLKDLASQDVSDGQTYIKMLKIYILQQDIDSAKKLIEEFSDNNHVDGSEADATYIMRIILARTQGDYDTAEALANEALQSYDNTPELDRQLALVYLYKGDYGKAYDSAFKADDTAYMMYYYYGDSSSYTDEVLFTLYLTAYLCKENNCENEHADYLDEIIDSYKEAEIPEKIQSIIDGKAKVKNILTEGVCDLL